MFCYKSGQANWYMWLRMLISVNTIAHDGVTLNYKTG